ncbi:hypothetical protein COT62_01235 [Candidatus Roizmanbacteria bacterium CG09_land_8_20_14_0_10_41_9]|uniref:Dihydrofolate reductase n=1 Tax=Candidatus Roizmanbacteria bacterium CG09_land_8_20_14_0_10_41_9 TaxID=1974850 RepID=A0A2H0WVH7_9BACT|nr:MAG: hypothetical protein COT62_01235 [Candidatus Roizmanbacteria bacterium CG09_land_8_20_14_0_10_41_9]
MIALIAAISKNRAIGNKNKLLWNIPDDLEYFKKITLNHPIIMGRKTFESIGRPLPKRTNIVITRNKDFKYKNCIVCLSIEEAIAIAKKKDEIVFVIGGAQIYKESLPYADRLYLTYIYSEPKEADAFFPDYSTFTRTTVLEKKEYNGIQYDFRIVER